MSTPESINRIPGLNRIARSKNIGKNLISMGNNRIGIHTMKMILDIRQRQHAHSHRIHNHILCSLNIEQSDIHCIINKTRLHRQPASEQLLPCKHLLGTVKYNRPTGWKQFHQRLHILHQHLSTFLIIQACCHHI